MADDRDENEVLTKVSIPVYVERIDGREHPDELTRNSRFLAKLADGGRLDGFP